MRTRSVRTCPPSLRSQRSFLFTSSLFPPTQHVIGGGATDSHAHRCKRAKLNTLDAERKKKTAQTSFSSLTCLRALSRTRMAAGWRRERRTSSSLLLIPSSFCVFCLGLPFSFLPLHPLSSSPGQSFDCTASGEPILSLPPRVSVWVCVCVCVCVCGETGRASRAGACVRISPPKRPLQSCPATAAARAEDGARLVGSQINPPAIRLGPALPVLPFHLSLSLHYLALLICSSLPLLTRDYIR